MLHLDLTLEDCRIVATRDNGQAGYWTGFAVDSPTGKTARFDWTDCQIAAVVALAFGIGEDTATDETLTAALYQIAETAIAGFPSECRPIP